VEGVKMAERVAFPFQRTNSKNSLNQYILPLLQIPVQIDHFFKIKALKKAILNLEIDTKLGGSLYYEAKRTGYLINFN